MRVVYASYPATPSRRAPSGCRLAAEAPGRPAFHLCIVNLVVGTLYCSRGNFEFGVGRVLQAMHPPHAKLGTDTWYYAKRCLLALAEGVAKHMVALSDATLGSVCRFLDAADAHGKDIPAVVARGAISECMHRRRSMHVARGWGVGRGQLASWVRVRSGRAGCGSHARVPPTHAALSSTCACTGPRVSPLTCYTRGFPAPLRAAGAPEDIEAELAASSVSVEARLLKRAFLLLHTCT